MSDPIKSECSKCLYCAKPRCKTACPVGFDVPSFLREASMGNYGEATQIVGHLFGEICGYVCPREIQCQSGCVLSSRGKAVKVGDVEQYVFARHPYVLKDEGQALRGVKIAVVGGGVSGLTFACAAYREGAEVTVFERDVLLSTIKSIPSFRLPKEAIERVEKAAEGKFKVVKQNITDKDVARLSEEYDFVYVAAGACSVYTLGIDGEEYATSYNDCLYGKTRGETVVIGGGNTAIDCSRVAVRGGNECVVAYRRTEEDMPAFKKEIAEAKAEGVKFTFNCAPVSLSKRNGRLVLKLAKTLSEGRGKLVVTNEVTEIICDSVVCAAGSRFDSGILPVSAKADNDGLLYGNVYVGGDARGGSLVSRAVADGLSVVKTIIEKRKN